MPTFAPHQARRALPLHAAPAMAAVVIADRSQGLARREAAVHHAVGALLRWRLGVGVGLLRPLLGCVLAMPEAGRVVVAGVSIQNLHSRGWGAGLHGQTPTARQAWALPAMQHSLQAGSK